MGDCTCPDVVRTYLPDCPVHGHISLEGDVHKVPGDGTHESSPKCWCLPHVVFVAQNGSQVWLHGGPS